MPAASKKTIPPSIGIQGGGQQGGSPPGGGGGPPAEKISFIKKGVNIKKPTRTNCLSLFFIIENLVQR